VIKKGKVWMITSSVDEDSFPFMEVDSHFGAYEAIHNIRNGWNVIAKEKTVIFSFDVYDVKRILKKSGLWDAFIANESDRLAEMVESNDKSGEAIRKLQTMS
jgi:hypothetical protein